MSNIEARSGAGRFRRLGLLVALLVLLAAFFLPTAQTIRQNRLNAGVCQAAAHGNAARVEELLRTGADANARQTTNPLTSFDLPSILRWIRSSKNAENGPTALYLAVTAWPRHFDVARVLILHGATGLNGRYDSRGYTLLHLAARDGDAYLTRLLLDRGVAVNPRDEIRSTPLHYAAGLGHLEIVRMLLEHDADVNARDAVGRTPILDAPGRSRNRTEIIRMLLERGADPNLATSGIWSPLIAARRFGNAEQIAALKAAGAKEHPEVRRD